MPPVFCRFRVCLLVFVLVWAAVSCKKNTEEPVLVVETSKDSSSDAFISLERSAYPAWFEFSDNGLQAVDSAASASLRSFEPWPYAYRLAGASPALNYVSMGVNRYGFISAVLGKDGCISFYKNETNNDFKNCSIAGVFSFKKAPSALLYRDRFFIESENSIPSVRVYSLKEDARTLSPVYPAAFEQYPGTDGWEISSLGLGRSGQWYFRAFKETDGGGEQLYCVSPSLDTQAEQTDAGYFRSALKPSTDYPAAVKDSFASMSSWFEDTEVQAILHAPQLEASREILLSGGTKGPVRLSAYTDDERTAILLPDGRGLIRSDFVQAFSLPSLPENFVYTTIILLGPTMICSWEEQDSWAVGAAGLLLCSVPE